jgi:hypothetical protein
VPELPEGYAQVRECILFNQHPQISEFSEQSAAEMLSSGNLNLSPF